MHSIKEKKNIRKYMRLERKKKSVLFMDACYAAAKIFLYFIKLNRGETIGIYWPIGHELDTRPLIKLLLLKNINLALPTINDKGFFFKLWTPYQKLNFSRLKFYTPSNKNKIVFPNILIVPCLAVDSKGNRIGYGSGHYDKYFKKNKKSKYVGYSYSFQYFKSLPSESHDLKLDYIVTEKFFKEIVN